MDLKESLKEQRAAKLRTEKKDVRIKFLWIRTWLAYFVASFKPDFGGVPSNIGQHIYATSNVYITNAATHRVYTICELGSRMPVTYLTNLLSLFRAEHLSTRVTLSMSLQRYYLNESRRGGLRERLAYWKAIQKDDEAKERDKVFGQKALYTYNLAKEGVPLYNAVLHIHLHCINPQELEVSCDILEKEFESQGVTYNRNAYKVADSLRESSPIGILSPRPEGAILLSSKNISQFFPNNGCMNDPAGYDFGLSLLAGVNQRIDPTSVKKARNITLIANSGSGKTAMIHSIMSSAYEMGYAVCVADIKGNEHVSFTKRVKKGMIVSLTPDSSDYINSWVLDADELEGVPSEVYYKEHIDFSTLQMETLAGIKSDTVKANFRALYMEFLRVFYINKGCIPDNSRTWIVTKDLTPFDVYAEFREYAKASRLKDYDIPVAVFETLDSYLSSTGARRSIFGKAFKKKEILDSNVLCFTFGLLSGSTESSVNEDLVKLKFLYMQDLNKDFVQRNYAKGKRTLKVLEEAQSCSEWTLKMYATEFTLRRAQLQDTFLICNSLNALHDSEVAKPIIENTTALLIGEMQAEARDLIAEAFSLQEYKEMLSKPASSQRYLYSFVLANRMEVGAAPSIVKVPYRNIDNSVIDKPEVVIR